MEKKITKKDNYSLIMQTIMLAQENNLIDIVTKDRIIEFCGHEIELLEKKKTSGSKKTNEQVDKNLDLVYNALVEMGGAVTPTELIAKQDLSTLANDSGLVTTQKISTYLNKLVANGKAIKTIEKKKSYFTAVIEDIEIEE